MKVDTALAESTLQSINPENGAVIPENLVPGRFVHFSSNNIDILDSSLNGKSTFHATQLTAWQRGPILKRTGLQQCPHQTRLLVFQIF